jgi:dTDP-4-amino-4,6-dideoxygalactose transaminase
MHLAGVNDMTDKKRNVVSTSMTCVATNAPIVTMGAAVRWADVDPFNGMVRPSELSKESGVINSHTKAVIVVAWAGIPPELRELSIYCRRQKIPLILDAAHAFGATYEGHPIHEFAEFTCYSFQAIKHFTTGDGGALICRSDADFNRAKSLKWFGIDRDTAKDDYGNWKGGQWGADVKELGYKFNMNNIAAAIGLEQMKHIDYILEKHIHNASIYNRIFHDFENITPLKVPAGALPSYWTYPILVKPTTYGVHPAHPENTSRRLQRRSYPTRDQLMSALNNEGIMAGVVHVPNHNYTCFKDNNQLFSTPLHGVRIFSENQISLPCGWWLNDEDIEFIANKVLEIMK